MEHARPPAELVLEGGPASRGDAWRKWKKQFEVFLKASGVSKESADVKASLLVNLIGAAGYEVYSTFKFSNEEKEDIDNLFKKFDEYFGTKPNITVSRYKFFIRNQEEGENIDQWVTSLRLLSQSCDFGELADSLIRDRIVCGVNSNTVRDRLLRSEDLSLSKAVQICQAAEISHEESRCIEGGSSEVRVDGVTSRGGAAWSGRRRAASRRGARRGGRPAGAPAPRRPCPACGSPWCYADQRCPAQSVLCYVCDKVGHFAKVCVQKRMHSGEVCNLAVEDSDEDSKFFIDVIQQVNSDKMPREWVENVNYNGKKFALKLDTGSMLNVISKNQYLNLGLSLSHLQPFTKRVSSFSGNDIPILGSCKLCISFKNKNFDLIFVVTDLNSQNVLGLEGCVTLGLISKVNLIQMDKFTDLFNGLGQLPGKYTIVVDNSVRPVVCASRKIPLGLRDKLSAELQRMESLGVIRKVTKPTDWVNAIVLVAKKNGDIRLCLDPRPLNRAVRRAHYSLPTVTELAVRLQGAQYFSVLDARSGFWMVQLDDASADLCTFSTPFGRYQFLRLPYGVSCAPEVFHAKLRQHLEDLEGTESFIDDVVVWGSMKEEHDVRLERLLNRSREIGIKYNRDKCKFGVSEIVYLGNRFNKHGMQPDDAKVKAIVDMPYPTDRKALERFLGMVNYLSRFIQNYSESVAVLRGLLKKNSEWIWDEQHSRAVDQLKLKISTAPVLALYSSVEPVVVSVDASSGALGAVLLQTGRPVEFASLTLTDTQTRYAQIEKEMLAIVFALERFKQYVYGRSDVTVQTDHKPLEALFVKPLDTVPARLQRMMMRVQGYDVRVVYTPGKFMYIADTLSRAPLAERMRDRVSEEVELQTCLMIENTQVSDQKLESIRQQTASDEDSMLLMKYIREGWPKQRWEVHEKVRIFWPYRDSLHAIQGIIFKNDLVYIPHSLRGDMVNRVHEGHLGIDRCKRRARAVMFWPGLGAAVERAVRGCAACALHAPAPRREPLQQHEVPSIPWYKLASDLFEYRKKYYIILVDYFSNYVEVGQLNAISSNLVIKFLKEQFARHGIPCELVTDNGPAYSSREFKSFMRDWEVSHVTSSPLYPQSNGKSERTVQTIKNLLKKCLDSGDDFYLSLLNYRSTPRDGIDSPGKILMGRRLNTKLPIKKELLQEGVNNKLNHERLLEKGRDVKINYDRSAKQLAPLFPGQKAVLVDGRDRKPVTVVGHTPEPRSFLVTDAKGRRYRRNRRQLAARARSPAAGPSAPPAPKEEPQGQEPSPQSSAPSATHVGPACENDSQPSIPITRSKARLLGYNWNIFGDNY